MKILDTTSPRPPATTPIRPRRLDQRFAPETLAEIAALYESGSSSNQLCKQYDLSKGSLMKILQDHGVQTRFQSMTTDEITQAAKLYEAGDSIKTIAHKLGKAKGSVWKALTSRGVQMRPPTR
ncbi:helix-turn-helix domain-containing protein [Nocardia sp. R7R-8]|uniref:helix-turn-helix domain-containing protein n=1 Tax=Nocardia sp. R7R-8 TaxID=3459304 RepID=UPI00403E1C6A